MGVTVLKPPSMMMSGLPPAFQTACSTAFDVRLSTLRPHTLRRTDS
jgi:hypothetical protein